MIAAAILAGGRASRWQGRPKGLATLSDGRSMLAHTIAALRAVGLHDIAIIANDPTLYLHLGPPVVPDLRPGNGPLGGIEAALAHFQGRARAVLILPCDLPSLTPAVPAALRAAFAACPHRVVVAESPGGFWQPLCAVVPTAALFAVSAALDEGRRGVHRLWRRLGARALPFPDFAPFLNANSPADLQLARG